MLTFMNVIALVHVATDPELTFTPTKTPVVNFAVAANRNWTDEGGTKHEESCFINCQAWNKLASAIEKSVKKGDPLYIEAVLHQDIWEKDGKKQTRHFLNLNRVIFLKPKEPEK